MGKGKAAAVKDRDQIIRDHPIEREFERRGIKLSGLGDEKACKCPFHEDKHASMGVNVQSGLWTCHACNVGGSVIDLIAKFENKQPSEVFKQLAANGVNGNGHSKNGSGFLGKPKFVKTYDYTTATGELVYQACRFEPKDFRQRRPDPANPGKWLWDMKGGAW